MCCVYSRRLSELAATANKSIPALLYQALTAIGANSFADFVGFCGKWAKYRGCYCRITSKTVQLLEAEQCIGKL